MDKMLVRELICLKLKLTDRVIQHLPGKLGATVSTCRKTLLEAAGEAIEQYRSEGSKNDLGDKGLEKIHVE